MTNSITIVYHRDCKASTDFIILAAELRNYDIEYIDIKTDKFETEINIDVVPFIIIDNKETGIFKGRAAFSKIEELKNFLPKKSIENSLKYDQPITYIAETSKGSGDKIDLDSKRKSR
jgi:hypothetical protein